MTDAERGRAQVGSRKTPLSHAKARKSFPKARPTAGHQTALVKSNAAASNAKGSLFSFFYFSFFFLVSFPLASHAPHPSVVIDLQIDEHIDLVLTNGLLKKMHLQSTLTPLASHGSMSLKVLQQVQ